MTALRQEKTKINQKYCKFIEHLPTDIPNTIFQYAKISQLLGNGQKIKQKIYN